MYLFNQKYTISCVVYPLIILFWQAKQLSGSVVFVPCLSLAFLLGGFSLAKWMHSKRRKGLRALAGEVAKRKCLEHRIASLDQELSDSQRLATLGSWEWHVGAPYINYTEEYRRIFGFKSKDIRLNDVCSLIYMDDVDLFKSAIERLMETGKSVEMEFRIVNCDNIFKILRAYLKMVCDEEGIPFKLCGIVQDITKIKQTEDLLMQKALQLDRSKKDLQQFVTVASHDLKEPLRKLQTYSGLLGTDCFNSYGEKGRIYINTIKKSAYRLHHLIEDLTIFSKIGLRKELFEETDLTNLLNAIACEIEAEHPGLVKITFDKMPVLRIIPEQIALLFQELIGNAIKFKKPDVLSEILITHEIIAGNNLGFAERSYKSAFCTNYCRIAVKDNGQGFDEKYVSKIFHVFQQLHQRGKYEGTGIGLAKCKKIADNHCGFITAKSGLNQGATFFITLPFNKSISQLN